MAIDADSLYRRGIDLVNEGDYAAAGRALQRAAAAAERADAPDLRARIAGTTAYLLAISGDAATGEELCRSALSTPGITTETTTILYGQLGSIEMSQGRLDSAADWLGRAIRGLDDDPVKNANLRMNRSVVNMDRGRLDDAKDDLEWAERAYVEAGLPLDAAQAAQNNAYIAMLEGDLVAALQQMQRVRPALEAESELWGALVEVDRAQALRDAGLATEAESSLERVVDVFGSLRARREQAEAEFQLARSLLAHDPLRAAVVARNASRRFRRMGSDAWAMRAEAVRMRAVLDIGRVRRDGSIQTDGSRLPSRASVHDLAEALDRNGAKADGDALVLAYRRAVLRAGRSDLDQGPVRVRPSSPVEVALLAYEVRAERARVTGREGELRRQAARGADMLERSQRTMGSLDLQGAALMQGQGLLTAGLSSALRSQRADVVFDWSERARHISTQIVPLRPSADAELANALAQLRMLRAEDPGGDWLSTPTALRLRDRARERQWSGTRTGLVHERVGLREAQAALAGDEAFVSYVFDGRHLAALVATPGTARVIPLSWSAVRAALAGLRADLDVSASIRSGPFAARIKEALDGRLDALSRLLLADADRFLSGATKLVLTAPGVLSGLPWTMLQSVRGRAVTVTPSVSRWVRERQAGVVGAPESAGFVAGPHVARGEEEVAASAAAWPARTALTGRSAGVDAVIEMAGEVDLLHVAAHGRHAADNPQFSGLELADGVLFGYDVDRMARVPGIVVLSACELGRSSVRWGEEAMGMTRVWLHAGARSVIAAPVIVADDVACELLGAMHEGLAAGAAPSIALAEASARTGIVAPFQVHGAGF